MAPAGKSDDIDQAHLAEPFAVVANFKMIDIGEENFADLCDVGFGVGVDFFAGELRAGFVAPGGVADAGGVIADDENGFVTEILKLADHAQRNGMAQRHIRRGGIHPQLDPQRLAGFGAALELRAKVLFAEDALAPAGKPAKLIVDGNHDCVSRR